MTIIEKNIAIAEMLGMKECEKPYKGAVMIDSKKTHNFLFFAEQMDGEDWYLYPKFHSDANWQFEAIDWIENLHKGVAYNVRIESNKCEISICTQYALAYDEHLSIFQSGATKKEAIFEALFQFSQYLKQ